MGRIVHLLKLAAIGLALLLAGGFAVRAWDALTGPPLKPWHLEVPDEPVAAEIDAMDWPAWTGREAALFAEVGRTMSDRLAAEDRVPQNRYWPQSPMNAANLAFDWNRSFVLEPTGAPVGAVVLLHGLTDAPYSLRHVAQAYRARGFVAIGVRMPGHGTVPAGLTKAGIDQWQAATRLAVREARRRVPAGPLEIVGYSNGGALALTHTLAALARPELGVPRRLVLLSPMIGLTPFARFAGIAGWPALVPGFVRAAWLGTVPEYNPYKYNSFPVHAAVQSHALTVAVGSALAAAQTDGSIVRMPPVLTFQSVADSTVSTRAVVTDLYDRLPANGSELVLIDINRAALVDPLLRPQAARAVDGLLPPPPRRYRAHLVANAAPRDRAMVAITTEPGAVQSIRVPLPMVYPASFFSLSHIALPFPVTDGLYGTEPDPADDQGAQLGALAVRGETGLLTLSMDSLARASANPFFDLLIERIVAPLPATAAR